MNGFKQVFKFEMTGADSCTESGAPITEHVQLEVRGEDLAITDVLAKFEDFLMSCGYSAFLRNKRFDVVDRDY
jgi:hypothetical protein